MKDIPKKGPVSRSLLYFRQVPADPGGLYGRLDGGLYGGLDGGLDGGLSGGLYGDPPAGPAPAKQLT